MKLTYEAKLIRLAQTYKAQKDVRFYLNGFLLSAKGEIVATDGHQLAITYSESKPDEDKIISLNQKVLKSDTEVTFDFDTMLATISNKKGVRGQFPFEIIDGRFPDHNRVLPTEAKPTESICFNANYLAAIAALGESGKYCKTRLTLHGPTNAVLFTAEDSYWPENTRIVLMPMRDTA